MHSSDNARILAKRKLQSNLLIVKFFGYPCMTVLMYWENLFEECNFMNASIFDLQEIEHLQHQNPWKIIQGEPPLPLPMAEQILYPRFKNAVLFAAQRVA